MSTETVTISRLGSGGDGIVAGPDGPIYVPFTLPGETVAIARVKNHGTVMSTAAVASALSASVPGIAARGDRPSPCIVLFGIILSKNWRGDAPRGV